MNTKFTKTVAVTGLTVSAFVAVCGFTNTAFADEAPAVVNTPVENPAPGSFRARLLANQAVMKALKDPNQKDKVADLIKAAKEESQKAAQKTNQPQAENREAAEDQNLGSVKNKDVEGVAALAAKTLEEYEAALRKNKQGLSEEQRDLYRRTLETKIKTLEKTYLEALDYAETIDKYDVKGADENLKSAAKEFLKNRDNFKAKSFADSDLTTINNVWKSSDEFNKKITLGLKSAIAQAKKKASEAAQHGTAGSHVESPAYPAPASPDAPNPADSEKNEAPSSQDAPSASAPSASAPSADAPSAGSSSAGAPSAGSSSAGAPSEDEISDLDIEDDWLKEISDYLESPEFDDLMKSYNFDNSNSDNSNSDNSNSDDFNLDDFNLDDFNLDDIDLSNLDDFNLDDFDFSDIDLNA